MAALTVGLGSAKPARAFTIESYATKGCHERVTADAWRRTAESLPAVTQDLPSSGDDDALMGDLPFEIAESLRSIGPTALLLGVRDNDVKEFGANDLESLGPIASDPELQAEHCLRGPADDEPEGSRQAVLACRSFIRQRLRSALDGLAADGSPDPSQRATLRVALAIRGKVAVSLPLFFLQAGRGLHALQDSFTHTFRDPDHPGHIRVALNFVDYTAKSLDEAVDGPEHASDLDRCDDPDELRTARRELATEASAVALTALLEPTSSRAEKEQAIERMLDDYVAFDDNADCSAENHWCDAPENQYGSPKLSCSSRPGAPPRHGAWALLALAGLVAARRRRARSVLPVAGALAVLGSASVAEAAPPSRAALADARACDTTALTPTDMAGALFGRVAFGASYEHTALAGGAGLRYAFQQKWMVGFDAEWNPYLALKPQKFRSGSANAYFSIIRRSQLQRASMNIRSSASLGAAMLLSDLVGADRFSVGPYFGLSLLGVEWKAARSFYVTIDPTYIAIPVPSLTGIPFMYVQYRFLVGVEFGG